MVGVVAVLAEDMTMTTDDDNDTDNVTARLWISLVPRRTKVAPSIKCIRMRGIAYEKGAVICLSTFTEFRTLVLTSSVTPISAWLLAAAGSVTRRLLPTESRLCLALEDFELGGPPGSGVCSKYLWQMMGAHSMPVTNVLGD